jgi:hypothetical protein
MKIKETRKPKNEAHRRWTGALFRISIFGFLSVLGFRFSDFRVSAADAPRVRVSGVTLFGDMECLCIETASAIYFYGKRGAGFASIVDPDGHDWISYRHGGKARGEYRGLPKCGQPVKYFHCGYGFGQYTNSNPFTTTFQQLAPDHIRVHSETKDGIASCDWDFFPTHATMTLPKIPGRYWFLYEGTPGGALDVADDFVLRPGGQRTPLAEPWVDDVRWMLFGAKESPFGLLLFAHQRSAPVSCVAWPYKPEPDGGVNQMTVAGFGRPGWQDAKQHTPPLETLPAKFSIAITRGATLEAAERGLEHFQKQQEQR